MLPFLDPRVEHALLLTGLGAAGTGLGGLLVVVQPKLDSKKLGLMQGLAAGLMLSISFFDLMPESVEAVGKVTANICFFLGVAFFAFIVAILPEPDASRLIIDDGLGESEPPGANIKGEEQQQQQQQQQQQHPQAQQQQRQPQTFQGEGRRLGNAQPVPPSPSTHSLSHSNQGPQVAQAGTSSHAAPPRQLRTHTSDALGGSYAACNTPTSRERQLLQQDGSPCFATGAEGVEQHQDSLQSGKESGMNTPTRQERDWGLEHADLAETKHHLQTCLAMMVSHGGEVGKAACELLFRILHNILEDAQRNPKFRQIKLSSPQMMQALEEPGVLEFLDGVGFVLCIKGEPGLASEEMVPLEVALQPCNRQLITSSDRHYAVLPAPAPLAPLAVGRQEVRQALHGMGAAVPGSSGGAMHEAHRSTKPRQPGGAQQQQQQQQQGNQSSSSTPIDRNTQVLLPVTPDTNVPDWFFERTPAEVKDEYFRLARQRARGEVLMTRSMRQATSKSTSRKDLPSTTTLRVRFPEGVVLQGTFGVREPCSCVHAWVAQALRFPGSCFELVAPNRQPLTMGGASIKDVPDIVPSAVLNFRMSGSHPGSRQDLSNLSDEMLKLTRAE